VQRHLKCNKQCLQASNMANRTLGINQSINQFIVTKLKHTVYICSSRYIKLSQVDPYRKPRLIREGYTFSIKQVSISVNIKETNI